MAMTHTVGDTFASATYWYNNPYSNAPDGILVNVYDIAQVLTGSGATPVYSMRSPIPPYCNYSIQDLRYSTLNNSLILLLNGCFLNSYNGSMISELPLPLPAGVSPIYLQDIYLTSLDNYKSQQNFVAQGYDGADPKQSISFTQPLSALPKCATTVNYPTMQSNYGEKPHYCPYFVCTGNFECGIVTQAASSTIPIKTICVKP